MTGRPVECVKMTLPFRLLDWNPSDRSVALKLLNVFLGRLAMRIGPQQFVEHLSLQASCMSEEVRPNGAVDPLVGRASPAVRTRHSVAGWSGGRCPPYEESLLRRIANRAVYLW
jgi:hypothetical protein